MDDDSGSLSNDLPDGDIDQSLKDELVGPPGYIRRRPEWLKVAFANTDWSEWFGDPSSELSSLTW